MMDTTILELSAEELETVYNAVSYTRQSFDEDMTAAAEDDYDKYMEILQALIDRLKPMIRAESETSAA
jgi:hypothetical protein